jgi:carbon storage regulator
MLTLTRKVKQSIMIGDDIKVRVLSIDRAQVRLGIEAPPDLSVFRTEIYVEIQPEQGKGAHPHDVSSEAEGQLRKPGD